MTERDGLKSDNERLKEIYAAHIGDEHDQCGVAVNQRLQEENERLRDELKKQQTANTAFLRALQSEL